MRIAYFSDTFAPQLNGVSNTLSQLRRYLRGKDIDCLFVVPDYETAEQQTEPSVIRFKGIRPAIYPECRLAFPPHAKVMEYLQDFKPDLIHVTTEQGIGYSGVKAARELGVPVVMSYHTNYNKYLDFYNIGYLSPPIWTYVRWFHSFAALNLCPSENTLDELEQRGFRNLGIWTRGIDMSRFNPGYYSDEVREALGGKDRTIFLYVGRIAVEKGLDTLAESVRLVNERHADDLRFVFTGDGPYLEILKSLKIPNTVFTGPQTGIKLSQIYASSDVFMFPSGSETFGNVMLEAMASGLPGICVDAGGVTDFSIHGRNAYISRYGDAADFAGAMEAMLDRELREKIRAGAIETARARDWDTIFDGLIAGYDTVLKKNQLVQKIAG